MAKGNIMRFIMQNYKGTNNKRNKGIAILWAALTLIILILMMGLAIDGGILYFGAHQLQNAADAAALAGAQIVKTAEDPCDVRNEAKKYAGLNYCYGQDVNLIDEDIIRINWFPDDRHFEVQEDPGGFANAVLVIARRTESSPDGQIPFVFGPIVDVDGANVVRYAIAMASGGTGAGLIALCCTCSCVTKPNPCDSFCNGPPMDCGPGLELVGNSIVDVGCGPVLGEVVINCDNCGHPRDAVSLDGGSVILNAAQMNVVGCYYGPETDYTILTEDPCNYMKDPLGCCPDYNCLMPQLDADPDNDLSPDPNICAPWTPDVNTIDTNAPDPNFTLWPGYYSGGINITSAPYPVYFKPGIYILDGEICNNINAKGGLKINGGTIDASEGVMFYILGGSMDIAGNPQLTMTEYTPWNGKPINYGDYEGMLIYQDPDNCTPARIIGTSDVLLVGTLYFPFNDIEIGGDGYAVGSQLIANRIFVHTSGEGVCIAYDGRFRAPGNKSFLVAPPPDKIPADWLP